MNPLNRKTIDNNWFFCMTVSSDSDVTPAQVMDALEAENIETRSIWKSMHLQPVFKDYDFIQTEDGISVSEDIFNRGHCLPTDHALYRPFRSCQRLPQGRESVELFTVEMRINCAFTTRYSKFLKHLRLAAGELECANAVTMSSVCCE